jgi:transposase
MDWVRTEAELKRRKERLGSFSKRGDCYLRSLFTTGVLAVATPKSTAQASAGAHDIVGAATRQSRSYRACQQDGQMAWAMMATGERYKEPDALAA